jgi:hypothetical protein
MGSDSELEVLVELSLFGVVAAMVVENVLKFLNICSGPPRYKRL